MSLDHYRESLDKQREGSPMHTGGMTFYVRRWGTPESQGFLKDLNRKLFGPFHKQQQSDQATIYSEWLCGYGVTGWDNCRHEEDGEEIPYSVGAAREIFTNEEYYLSLNLELISDAMKFENYLHDEANEDLEDLKKK